MAFDSNAPDREFPDDGGDPGSSGSVTGHSCRGSGMPWRASNYTYPGETSAPHPRQFGVMDRPIRSPTNAAYSSGFEQADASSRGFAWPLRSLNGQFSHTPQSGSPRKSVRTRLYRFAFLACSLAASSTLVRRVSASSANLASNCFLIARSAVESASSSRFSPSKAPR